MKKYQNIKVYQKTYLNIEEVRVYLKKIKGVSISKVMVVNFLVEKFKDGIIKK
jgi:hypothetical protein